MLSPGPPPDTNEISGIFSILSNRPPYPIVPLPGPRWPSFSFPAGGGGGHYNFGFSNPLGAQRSFLTKYAILLLLTGSAATILAGIFLVVAALFRYYTSSIYYFETVPTYIPAILLSICGVSTIAFSCKRNRNIILLRITACWSLCSAALSSVITITTSLIHMNRLQTLKECVYNKFPPSCTCFSHAFGIGPGAMDPVQYNFENTPDCDVIHGILYSCLRAVFAISVVAVLLSIFLCMLLYQLIGHERKKAYWSRIRRINSDWSADFIACLSRPAGGRPPSTTVLPGLRGSMPPQGWGPPPPYEELAPPTNQSTRLSLRPSLSMFPSSTSSDSNQRALPPPPRVLRLVTSQSEGLLNPHPFSPTITSLDPPAFPLQSSTHSNLNYPSSLEPLSFSSITSLSIPSDGGTLMSPSTTNGSLTNNFYDEEERSGSSFQRIAPLASGEEELTFGTDIGDDQSLKGLNQPLQELRCCDRSLSRISSLPSSPLLNPLKRFWPSRKSVGNLSKYSNLLESEGSNKGSWGPFGRRRLISRGKPDPCLMESKLSGCGQRRGSTPSLKKHSKYSNNPSSLPSSPHKTPLNVLNYLN